MPVNYLSICCLRNMQEVHSLQLSPRKVWRWNGLVSWEWRDVGRSVAVLVTLLFSDTGMFVVWLWVGR